MAPPNLTLVSDSPVRDPQAGLSFANAVLVQAGFDVQRDATTLTAIGPGWNSTGQTELRAASTVLMTDSHGVLSLHVELGGLQQMQRFATFFPAGLWLVLLGFFALTAPAPPPWPMLLVVVAVLGIGVLMSQILRIRVERALGTFFRNLVAESDRPSPG